MKRHYNKRCKKSWTKIYFDAGTQWARRYLGNWLGEGRFFIEPHYIHHATHSEYTKGSDVYFEHKAEAVLFALKHTK